MKSSAFVVALCLASGTAFAGDCGGGKMKPTDAQAPAASKVAEAPKAKPGTSASERESMRLVAQNSAAPLSAAQPTSR